MGWNPPTDMGTDKMLTFDDHVSACEYMGEENPKMRAWSEGPTIGAARVAYANSHKAHMAALETGNIGAIDSAWDNFCAAQNAWIETLYR
jgi:hypothetical protein